MAVTRVGKHHSARSGQRAGAVMLERLFDFGHREELVKQTSSALCQLKGSFSHVEFIDRRLDLVLGQNAVVRHSQILVYGHLLADYSSLSGRNHVSSLVDGEILNMS